MANTSLSLKEMPDCWRDDKRMNSLFSPFRQKDLNPVDYESKMSFWFNLIDNWCLECGRATFTVKYLQTAFRRNNAFPSCLQTVVDELLKSGDLMTKEKFASLSASESWATWAVKSIVKTPAVWSFNKLREALTEIDPGEIEYVSVTYLKAVAADVIARCQSDGTAVMPFEEFVVITDASNKEQASHVLKWLVNSGEASTTVHSGKQVVKVGKGSISEGELAIMELNRTINRLNESVKILEAEKIQAGKDAISYISKNMKQTAKSCLRRKKYLDEHITKKLAIVDNLDSLLCRLNGVKVNAEVMDSYKLGLSAWKSSLAAAGLNEDSVANTMTELEEVKEIHEEIENALAQTLNPADEWELEEEWMSILKADEQRPPSSPMPNLPEVPTADPKSSSAGSRNASSINTSL